MKDRANVQAVVEQHKKISKEGVDEKDVEKREVLSRTPEETVRVSGWGPNVFFTVDI